jgi:DNA modification methylase
MLNRPEVIRFGRAGEPADRLVHGDNLALLPALPDQSAALIYLDPPFGTGGIRATRSGRGYPDHLSEPENFVTWLFPRLEHCRRLLTTTGSLFVHLDYRTAHYVKVALDRLFGRARFVNEIAWCYSVGGKSNRSFGRKHDTILWFARSANYAFYPEAVRIARKPSSHMRLRRSADGSPVQEKTDRRTGKVYRYPVWRGKVPEDWWIDIETLNRGDRERVSWPTQKPERLLERIVTAVTARGDVVADWFCGSGTTAVVAQRLDRRFLVADCERDAVQCARDRLQRAGRTLALAGTPPRDIAINRLSAAKGEENRVAGNHRQQPGTQGEDWGRKRQPTPKPRDRVWNSDLAGVERP